MKLNYAEITIIIGMLKREERKSAERCEVNAKDVELAKRRFQEWLRGYRKRVTKNGVDAETAEKTIDQAFEGMVTPYEESYRVVRAYHNNTERILNKFTEGEIEI